MNNKYKICVYAIFKNEEQFVDIWMDHVSDADLIYVTDTSSTDNTVKKINTKRCRCGKLYNRSLQI